jgi:aminomethyltransferase
MEAAMKRTALYDAHVALGARMVEFGGWEMPVQYTSILEEHHAVREAAGLFDIDHMGQIEVQGPDALPYLQHLATNDIAKMEVWEAAYGLLCYADGGVVDDIFTYRLTSRFFIAVNASNTDKDYAWMLDHTAGYDVQVTNLSEQTCMLALQGPKSEDVLHRLTSAPLSNLPNHHCLIADVAAARTLIGRTGYTGEDGFELFFPVEHARNMWDAVLEAGKPLGLKPCGLGARDSLRFEAKMPLYGQEIGPDINPIEAGLAWAVAFNARDKQGMIGRDALLKCKLEGSGRRLTGFEMIDHGIARHNYPIAVNGQVVGHVTTGMYSPTLHKNIGLGYVPAEYAKKGAEFEVIIRGKSLKAVVVPTPFYKRSR